MRPRILLVGVVVAWSLSGIGLLGCNDETIEDYPCDAFCPDEDAGADVDPDTGGDVSTDAVENGRWVGTPCAADGDCAAQSPGAQCANETLLGTFGLDLDIPNGFCSRLFCTDDEQCGEGGLCFDTEPFTGTNIAICLQACVETAECRWLEGYGCYELDNLDEELDGGVCIPQGLTVAIECNDAHCDVNTDGDVDADGMDIWDYRDNCPYVSNGDQADADGDGLGDACDPVDDTEAE